MFATSCLVPVLCGIEERCRCCILTGGIQAFRGNSFAEVEGLRYLSRYSSADSKYREKYIALVSHCYYSQTSIPVCHFLLCVRQGCGCSVAPEQRSDGG